MSSQCFALSGLQSVWARDYDEGDCVAPGWQLDQARDRATSKPSWGYFEGLGVVLGLKTVAVLVGPTTTRRRAANFWNAAVAQGTFNERAPSSTPSFGASLDSGDFAESVGPLVGSGLR